MAGVGQTWGSTPGYRGQQLAGGSPAPVSSASAQIFAGTGSLKYDKIHGSWFELLDNILLKYKRNKFTTYRVQYSFKF